MTERCASVLMPIPEFVWPYIYEFDPAHPEYGIDEAGKKCLQIDECIAPAIQALWDAGIPTSSCCCGHGQSGGYGATISLPSRCREGGKRALHESVRVELLLGPHIGFPRAKALAKRLPLVTVDAP